MKKLLIALCLLASPSWAQNPQCPDRPAGDATNACANTRFVSQASAGIANVKGSPYNAKGDGVRGTDGAITGTTTTFSSASANFTTDDVGKIIVIQGAGALTSAIGQPRTPHVSTITARLSATSVSIAVAAVATVSGAVYQYGSDDTSAIQSALNQTTYGTVYFPKGRYLITAAGLTGTGNKQWLGDGIGVTTIAAAAKPTTNFILFNTQPYVTLTKMTFDGFELLYDFTSGLFPKVLPIIYYLQGHDLKITDTEWIGFDNAAILTNVSYNIEISGNYITRTTQSSGHLEVGGGTTASDGAINSGAATLTSASSAFVGGDVGKIIIIEGAGAGGTQLVATIASRISGTQITINRNAVTSVTNARFQFVDLTLGKQVSITGIEMGGTGIVDGGELRQFTITNNVITNASIGVSGHDGVISNNVVKGATFGGGIYSTTLASNFNLVIDGNSVTRSGIPMQDTAGAYPDGIENWATGSVVSNNVVSYSTGPGIAIGARTVVSGNTSYNNGQMNTVSGWATVAGFAGISLFYQDATFNASGTLVTGNKAYDTQTPKTQEYGYTEHPNLGVGCPGACQGSNISQVGNDFSGNLTANVLLQALTSRSTNMGSTVTIDAGGFNGGTYNTSTLISPAISQANPLSILNAGTGAFGLQLRPNTIMTANRILDLNMDANRVVTLGGNFTITTGNTTIANTFSTTGTFSSGGNFSTSSTFSVTGALSIGGAFTTAAAVTFSGANAITLTTSAGTTNLTLPAATDTVAILGTSQTFTGAKNFNNASTFGTGTGNIGMVANGGNSGTGSGAYFVVQNGGTSLGAIGNVSAWYGGAYNAGFMLVSASDTRFHTSGGPGTNGEAMRLQTGLAVGSTTDPGSGAISANSFVKTGVTTVGALPACGASTKGAHHFVTDSNAASYTAGIGAVVAAGGATNVPVTCDGTNWRIGANDNQKLRSVA